MLLRFSILAALLALSSGCEQFPNGTETTFNWWPCASVAGVTVSSMKPVNADGSLQYPVKLTDNLNIAVSLVNNKQVYDKLTLDVSIWEWGGFNGCAWSEINTFGLLAHQDACTNGFPCPLNTGSQAITVELLFKKFGAIIGLLKNNAAYQIQYKLTAANGDTVCLMAQARALTH
uniref:ML domain-containing protein n=1 Tax=Steinernema glaseri TaxID=37863 RepID=A0A1I8AUQ8_9BILA